MLHSGADLAVVDSDFRRVSIELDPDGELWVALPWSLDSLEAGGYLVKLSWDTFGMDGLN